MKEFIYEQQLWSAPYGAEDNCDWAVSLVINRDASNQGV
jgi:hypothetical protein